MINSCQEPLHTWRTSLIFLRFLRFLMGVLMVGVMFIQLDFVWGFQKCIILGVLSELEGPIWLQSGFRKFWLSSSSSSRSGLKCVTNYPASGTRVCLNTSANWSPMTIYSALGFNWDTGLHRPYFRLGTDASLFIRPQGEQIIKQQSWHWDQRQ